MGDDGIGGERSWILGQRRRKRKSDGVVDSAVVSRNMDVQVEVEGGLWV